MTRKKAVLISGGGSWGAYGGGTLARLNRDYNTVVGISTGAIMSPLVALKKWDSLKEAYTTINRHTIFDRKWYKPTPITKKGKLNKLSILLTLLLGQKSVGTSTNLRKEIDRFFPKSYFDRLKYSYKEIFIGVQNLAQNPSDIHYFNNIETEYEDFKDWMWCSANFPFFTSLVKKGWYDKESKFHVGLWSDGGLSKLVGFDALHSHRYKEVDIILHKTKFENKYEDYIVNNLMDNITTSVNAMQYNIEFSYFKDEINKLLSKGTTVNVYWLPRKLSTNSMFFNRNKMLEWWNEGYETAFDLNRREVYKPRKKSRD